MGAERYTSNAEGKNNILIYVVTKKFVQRAGTLASYPFETATFNSEKMFTSLYMTISHLFSMSSAVEACFYCNFMSR